MSLSVLNMQFVALLIVLSNAWSRAQIQNGTVEEITNY